MQTLGNVPARNTAPRRTGAWSKEEPTPQDLLLGLLQGRSQSCWQDSPHEGDATEGSVSGDTEQAENDGERMRGGCGGSGKRQKQEEY